MLPVSQCDSINMTDNAIFQHSFAEERIMTKKKQDDHYVRKKQR